MATTLEVKQAVNKYNGKKRITDLEVKHIWWFMRTKKLSLEDAVKAYYEDKEESKRLGYSAYIARRQEIRKDILSHCTDCPRRDSCIKNIFLEADTEYTLDDLKVIQRSECWR